MSTVDLSKLPPPTIIEPLDFETIRDAMLVDLAERDPDLDGLLPSDPAYRVLEVAAYRELLLRARINDGVRAVLPPLSWGANLDQVVTLVGITSRVADESDAELLQRFLAAWSRQSTAGTIDSYRTHALAAHAQVADVAVTRPTPGQVLVTVLSTAGDGTPSTEVLAAVEAIVTDPKVRPLNDTVTVEAATIVTYAIEAEIFVAAGPDEEVVRQAALDRVTALAADRRRLGRDIRRALIYAALGVQAVEDVDLVSPSSDTLIGERSAAYALSIDVTASQSE